MTELAVEVQEAEALVVVGGVPAPGRVVEDALGTLRVAPGLMVRQPLQRAGNPLAGCDYHTAAAPYKPLFSSAEITGRGAAGRHITKQAFMFCLERALEVLGRISPVVTLFPLVNQAWEAFTSDCSYAAEMAAEAVALLRAAHTATLRRRLNQASHQAVSACEARQLEFICHVAAPCGTGSCRFASPDLAFISAASVKGAGRRPANHDRPRSAFSILDALPELEAAEPFQAVPR